MLSNMKFYKNDIEEQMLYKLYLIIILNANINGRELLNLHSSSSCLIPNPKNGNGLSNVMCVM